MAVGPVGPVGPVGSVCSVGSVDPVDAVGEFGSVGADLTAAAADYKRAVHTGEFPGPEHAF